MMDLEEYRTKVYSEYIPKTEKIIQQYSSFLEKHCLIDKKGERAGVLVKMIDHRSKSFIRSRDNFDAADATAEAEGWAGYFKAELLDFLVEEHGEEELKSDLVKLDRLYVIKFQELIIAEFSPFLKKHKLLSEDGKLDKQIINLKIHIKDPFKFKSNLLKTLINYGEEHLQDDLDAVGGQTGAVEDEFQKEIKVLEEKIRKKYKRIVERYLNYKARLESEVEVGIQTQEEANKKLEEARKHTAEELNKLYEARTSEGENER